MSQAIGLIEIETDDVVDSLPVPTTDDETLDALFARLVGNPTSEPAPRRNDEDHSVTTTVLEANLDALSADLRSATREVLTEIFLSLGRR